jgi:hypothetical protein
MDDVTFCPECLGRVSAQASRCPRCGWRRSDAGWQGVVKVILGIAAAIGAMLTGLIVCWLVLRTRF